MINIIQGDATHPQTDGRNIIVHGVNSIGAWGSGFVLAVDKISPIPRIRYKAWAKNKTTYCPNRNDDIPFELGRIQLVVVKPKLAVCNLISQVGCGSQDDNGELIPPASYEAIHQGLSYLRHYIFVMREKIGVPIGKDLTDKTNLPFSDITLHLPMIGAGLGGLYFGPIYDSICDIFPPSRNIDVNIYGFNMVDYKLLKSIENKRESSKTDLTHGVSMV